jgi:hypothetical protein
VRGTENGLSSQERAKAGWLAPWPFDRTFEAIPSAVLGPTFAELLSCENKLPKCPLPHRRHSRREEQCWLRRTVRRTPRHPPLSALGTAEAIHDGPYLCELSRKALFFSPNKAERDNTRRPSDHSRETNSSLGFQCTLALYQADLL